jgi:hypothetical protein
LIISVTTRGVHEDDDNDDGGDDDDDDDNNNRYNEKGTCMLIDVAISGQKCD